MSETPHADELAAMTDAELIEDAAANYYGVVDEIARRVVEKLGRSVIPSVIPAEIGQLIRDAAGHGGFQWRYSIPLMGPNSLITQWYMQPNGSLRLELLNPNGEMFWRGTFEIADE